MKKFGLVLLTIVVILVIVSAFLPGKIHVERSVMIDAPVKSVFDQVNTLSNWKNWSHWDQIDTNMKSDYEGPVSGAGAVHKWSSENDSVGSGVLTIVESTEPNTILISLNFEGMGTSTGGWMFDDTGEGVRATTYMDLNMPFYSRIFPGLMMDEWLGKDFDKSLSNLKIYCESLSVITVVPPSWEVEVMNTEPVHVMSVRMTVAGSEFTAKLGETYGRLMEAIGKQGLRQTGPVYAVYHKWSPEEVDLEPGIPVDKPGKEDGDIKTAALPITKVMKVDYYGDYPGSEKAHYFMDEWAKQNNIKIIGAPWEEYVTDPMTEPDTLKWLTRIYYPVE
jgi:effector-binding domain-containing protein